MHGRKEKPDKVIVGNWGITLPCPCCNKWFETYIRITDYAGFGRIYHCCSLKIVKFVPKYWWKIYLCLEMTDGKRRWYAGGLYGKFYPLDPDAEEVKRLESLHGFEV
jgi:hypothetical protein